MAEKKSFRKYAVGTLAATAAVAAAAPTVAADSQFVDVTEPHEVEAVNALVDAGIIKGYTLEDGTKEFRPAQTISRSQAAALFTRALELEVPENAAEIVEENFNDVPGNHYNVNDIAATYLAGIFTGDPNNNFNDDEPLSRSQMATVLVRAFNLEDTGEETGINLDNVVGHKEGVKILAQHGLTTEFDDFRPAESVSRGQFSTFLYRAMNLSDDGSEETPSELAIESVNAVANDDKRVSVTGEVANADRVTVTIDGQEKSAELADDGRYSFMSSELAVGVYDVTVTAYDGDNSVTETAQVAVVDEATQIAGFVINTAGNPVSGATVEVNGEEFQTNSDGFYQISGIATDSFYDLNISKPEHESVTERVRVTGDEVSTVITEDFTPINETGIEVTGDVVDSVTGEAVNADIQFQAYSDELEEWVTVYTEGGTGGSFTIDQGDNSTLDEINPGNFLAFGEDYRLVLGAPGYHSETVDFTIADDRQVTELPATQLAEIAETDISGKVTRDGSSVDSAEVVVVETGDVVTTNANGNFKFEDLQLASGDYNLAVTYTQGAGEETVSTTPITVEEGTNLTGQNIELALGTPASLEVAAPAGKSFDNAAPVSATVLNSDGVEVATATDTDSDENNRLLFEFDKNLPAGDYTVVVNGDYVVETEYNISVSDADVANFVDNGEEKETISGEAYEAVIGGVATIDAFNLVSDYPLPGDETAENAVVVLNDASGNEVDRAVVDAGASPINFTGLETGRYSVELYKPGYLFDKEGSTRTAVNVEENGDASFGTLNLEVPSQWATAEGLVRDAETLAAVDATVSFYREGNLVETVDNGSSYNVNLDPGIYTVVVRDVDAEYVTHVEQLTLTNKQELENYHFDLEPGVAQVDVSVVDGANKEIEADTVTLYDAYADRSDSDDPGIIEVTDVTDHLFEQLSTGEYEVVVEEEGFDTQSLAFSLEDKEDFRTTVVMTEESATYQVTVESILRGDNTPADELRFVIFNENGDIIRNAAVGAASTTTSTFNLANGSYTAAVYADGYYVSSEAFTIDRADETVLLEVEEGDWEPTTP